MSEKKITALWADVEWDDEPRPQKKAKLQIPGWNRFFLALLAQFSVWILIIPVAVLWPNSDFMRDFALQEFSQGVFLGVYCSGFRWKMVVPESGRLFTSGMEENS